MNLLDVNVLIALLDQNHSHHHLAIAFFRDHSLAGWATCPITENGCLRIMGHRKYPNGPGSPNDIRMLLTSLISMPGHQFWPDEPSLLQAARYPTLPESRHLTDFYLLALAMAHEARLVTFDHRINPQFIEGAATALYVIS